MAADRSIQAASLIELFSRLIAGGTNIRAFYVTGHWLDVDNPADLSEAGSFL